MDGSLPHWSEHLDSLLPLACLSILALAGLLFWNQRRIVRRGAAKLKRQLDEVYRPHHEYRSVRVEDFPWLDREFYDNTEAELKDAGYTRLGDIEDETVSRAMPGTRTCMRVFIGDHGAVRAAAFHVRPRGRARVLQWLGLLPRNMRVVDFVSEVPEGRFISTASSEGIDHRTYPPEVSMERLPVSTPVLELLERHRERLQETLDRDGAAELVILHTQADVLASVQRGNAVIARQRQAIGGLTEEELESTVGRSLNAAERQLLTELRSLEREPVD